MIGGQAPLSFDAYDEDGNPRLLAGVFRPPFEEWKATNPFPRLGMVNWHDEWMRGSGDRPLYYVNPPPVTREAA